MYNLTCSIVLYNTSKEIFNNAINSILHSRLKIKLYLIDNSETDELRQAVKEPCIDYIFNNKNIGFGNAHNLALSKTIDNSQYHLVLNPDIEFLPGVLEDIYYFMQNHKHVGQLMPKVFYKNEDLQKLCNLLPNPVQLLGRRFFPTNRWSKELNNLYDLKGFNYNTCANIPNLSGCFMFMRSAILKKTGGFDKRFFLYMEDVDLTRRIHQVSETLFYPLVNVYHKYEKESYSNNHLLKHHIISAIKYFNKWGWLNDTEREQINKETLKRLQLL